MAPLEKPISEASLVGGERTVDNIGLILTGLTAAGVAAHAVASAIRHKGKDEEEKHD
jgi:Ni,Fe-hydrogenase I small subunit